MADRRLTLRLCKVKAGASEAVTGGGLREFHGVWTAHRSAARA